MENNRKNRVIEWGKSGLILLLTLSALWLAAQTPLAAPLRGLLREEGRQAAPGQVQGDVQGSGALPMMMVANLPVETGMSGGGTNNMSHTRSSLSKSLLLFILLWNIPKELSHS